MAETQRPPVAPAGIAPPPGQPMIAYDTFIARQVAYAEAAWADPELEFDEREADENPFYYSQTCLICEDFETQAQIPLHFKPIQRRVVIRLWRRYLSGEPVRAIILKARREGVSTAVQALFFFLVNRPNTKALTIAHDDETSKYLFGMAETFYENLPPHLTPLRATSQTGKLLELANPTRDKDAKQKNPGLNSSMRTITLKNQGAGQGYRLLHQSEVGLWDEQLGRKANQTVVKGIPTAPYTIIVRESTARGVGNMFHTQWVRAESNISDFEAIFIGWNEEPTYQMRIDPGEVFVRTQEEQDLADEHGLTDEQLKWRRWAIENLCDGDIDNFHQEYPLTADEAFLASGRQFFPARAVQEQKRRAEETRVPFVGHLVELPEHPDKPGDTNNGRGWILPVAAERGFTLRIWEQPEETEDYLIFGDAAGGKPDAEILAGDGLRRMSKGDWHAAYVLRRSTLRVVAAWHGRVDRDEYGDHLYRLGKWYSGVTAWKGPRLAGALIAVEVTGGWGQVPISRLKWRGYPRIYMRTTGEDRHVRDQGIALGWDSTQKTRPLMLDALKQAIRTAEIECPDPYFYAEAQTFIYNDVGKPEAMAGCFDDRVMALSGAVYLWQTHPREHEPVEVAYEPPLSLATGY